MKKLRRKVILGVLASSLVVFALTVLIFGIVLNTHVVNRADAMTELINKSGGEFPDKREYDKLNQEDQIRLYNYDEESRFRLRYFVAYYDENLSVTSLKTEHIAAVDDAKAEIMALSAIVMDKPTGNYGDYRYRICEDTHSVIFLDVSDDFDSVKLILLLISGVALLFIVLITVVFWFLSKRIVQPFEENSRMQKQFITDASHELKTPLAIISANAEVLAYKNGEHEWINNITAQVERIGGLINELLTLNRLEEVEEISDIEPVDLSALVPMIAADFAQVFESAKASVVYDIEPDIVLNGNRGQLERLISVLVENASKYISEDGEFRITVKKDLRHTYLSFFNTCEVDPDADYKHLFDRFYRPDASRTSKTGGHGIGLSIAKRIVTLHNGTIEAVPSDDGLSFNVKLSNRLKAQR